MRKQKKTQKTIQFFFRNEQIRDLNQPPIASYLVGDPDHLVILRPDDVGHVIKNYLDTWLYYGKYQIDKLAITNETHQVIDLESILDALESKLTGEARIEIQACFVSQSIFVRLVEKWDSVYFTGCEMGSDAWMEPNPDSKCRTLGFQECSTSLPSAEVGLFKWNSLEDLHISENFWDKYLHGPNTYRNENVFAFEGKSRQMVAEDIKVFFSASIRTLGMDRCGSVEFLAEDSSLQGLRMIDLYGSPCTEEVFRWICTKASLTDVELTWRPSVKIDCSKLSNLKKLRSICATSIGFDDEDVEAIARSCPSLRNFKIYYSGVTPASWRPALMMESLRSFWVSMEMTQGSLPDDLPETTNLKEIVAMNTHLGFLPQIIEKYPGLELHEM